MGAKAVAKPVNGLLSRRERTILSLVGRGLTNQEIADQLWISSRTVKCMLHRACVKLGAGTRDQAVIRALKRRALSVHEIFTIDEMVELMASMPPDVVARVAEKAQENHGRGQSLREAEGASV